MQKESRHRVETVFHAARERAAGAERAAYLDGACGDDAELRARVEALLAADDEASGFLEEPAVDGSREGPGATIGAYKLLQEIGEGGMGVVYMAEQERPVRRKVALKIIKLGMDTKQVIARFEAERQALAMMDHQNIARVLDVAATEAGRPYFVMELVRGVPINEYCDTHKLETNERLELFVQVCRAVQHAHQKGIIHRDIKPTNVLVSSHDGVPVPKIIDFGVAKATNQRLTERTLFTEFHQIIGTLEYMSPEQAEMSGLDVDTRSDIYSLGVLLYQLLTGSTPVDPQALRTAGFEEMTRMIREDEPAVPSTRISKRSAQGQKIANLGGADVRELVRRIRGDLDWIVMKALEKDRTRRYETAAAFAEDVVRHLENRPVEAGPPGTLYRTGKFVRRNRKPVAAALVLALAVALGLAGTTAGFLRARAEAERSGRISTSLQDVLAMTDPARAADRDEIEDALDTVRATFGADHATYAAVLDTLAKQLHDSGDFEAAVELGRDALEVWEKAYGERHPNVAVALARLGRYLRAAGDDEAAESALRSALAGFERAPDAPGFASHDARVALADLLANRGEYAEADELFGEAVAALRATEPPPHYRILETLEQRVVVQLNRPAGEALDTLRQIYEESQAFYPDDSPMLAIAALGYGRHLLQADDRDAAERLLREAVERFRACGDPPRIYYLAACDALFQLLRARTDRASVLEADRLLADAIEAARVIWRPEELATNLAYYASRMVERERFGDAFDAMLEAHAVLAEADSEPEIREGIRDHLTRLAFEVASHAELEPAVYARAREAAERAVAEEPDHPAMIAALGAVLYREGEIALAAETLGRLARPLSEERGGLARRIAPGDHAFRALVHARLGDGESARAELDALLSAIGEREPDELVREVVRAVDPSSANTPSPPGDDDV